MKTINVEQLLQLHVLAIQLFGGSDGLRDMGRLDAALATQTQEIFGEESYPDFYAKAAALARGIIGDHPFADGNKRTGMLAAITFLEINDVKFLAEPGELEDFAVKIATDRLDVPAIAAWLRNHTV